MPQIPKIGEDVTALMQQSVPPPVSPAPPALPPIGGDVSDLMGGPKTIFRTAGLHLVEGEPAEKKLVFRSESTGTLSEEAREFGSALWQQINPLEFVRFVGEAARHPIQTAQGALAGQGQLFQDAKAEFAKGDYAQAARKFAHYLLPVIGQGMDAASEAFEAGEPGKGLGATTGLGLNLASGKALSAARNVRLPAALKNQNPTVAAAVEQGTAAGVPVDLAAASGNSFIQNTQKLLGQTSGGSLVAGRAVRRQADALEAHGRRLADDVHSSPMTPETAGAATMDALHGRVNALSRQADDSYAALRRFEERATPQSVQVTTTGRVPGGGVIPVAQPKQVKLAVDVRAAKAELRPLFDRLQRQAQEFNVPMQGGQARAIQALDDLMRADDFASLSVVDKALGELKALQRSLDSVDTSAASAISSQAVKALDRQVVMTARNAGSDVLKALLEGRKATVAKHVANDVLESLGGEIKAGQVIGEPVGAFRRTTVGQDAAINRLRRVARETPDAMPRVGRAVLDDLFEKATAEGGFGRSDRLFRDWNNLGAETKKLLFTKPGQVQALDNFFLLAKKMAENPNRSGSALTAFSGIELGAAGTALATGNVALLAKQAGFALTTAALTKALYSPALVRLLTKGMTIPAKGPAAVAWANAFTKAARDAGVELVPAMTDDGDQAKSQ